MIPKYLCLNFICVSVSCFGHNDWKRSTTQWPRFSKIDVESLSNGEPSMHTALCIIPSEEVWDPIQRARYEANDETYTSWPPAIRLFHPFCPRREIEDAAFDTAKLVEKHDISPFLVTFSSFSVVPNLEAIEASVAAIKSLPEQKIAEEQLYQLDANVAELLQREEKIGRERRKRRKNKTKALDGIKSVRTYGKTQPNEELEKQKKMNGKFNGPCMVCLVPDSDSKTRLDKLRDILRTDLFEKYEIFSPTSFLSSTGSLSQRLHQEQGTHFRPLIPIGNFATADSAVSFAKKMKKIWRPLSFEVTDLQFLSDYSDSETLGSTESADRDGVLSKAVLHSSDQSEQEEYKRTREFGCDASVMLMGEELEQDIEVNEIMADFTLREGIPGGGETSLGHSRDEAITFCDKNSSIGDNSDEEDLLAWLDDDDDEGEEGFVFVLGRTHFFSGEMRYFDGMPAASVVDRDQNLSESRNNASVRRKSTAKAPWSDEDFGQR